MIDRDNDKESNKFSELFNIDVELDIIDEEELVINTDDEEEEELEIDTDDLVIEDAEETLVIEDDAVEDTEDDLVIEDDNTISQTLSSNSNEDLDMVDLTQLVNTYNFSTESDSEEEEFDDLLDDEEETLEIDLNDVVINDNDAELTETELTKLELLIAKLDKERTKVDIEENRQELISMLNNAILELKGYVNNTDTSLIMDDSEDNSKLLYHDDVNREYFEQLITWFRREYIKHCSVNERYTAEMFINSDIKENLLELGDRLDAVTKRKVLQLKRFRPADLLSSEYLVKQLELKIKEDIETINSSFVDKDKLKSEKSNLVVSLSKTYLPNNFRVKGEYTLVKNISFNEDGENYVCGKCGETSKASQPFYLLGILPFQGVDNPNRANVYTTVDIPGVNECPHCHARNSLTVNEIKRLSKAFTTKQKQLITDFVKASKVLCTGIDITRYRSSISTLVNALPNIYLDSGYSAGSSEEQTYTVDYSEAYKKYLKLINYFKAKVDFDEVPTSNVIPYIVNEDYATVAYPKLSEQEVFKDVIGSHEGIYNTAKFTKIICKCLGVNYTTIKNNAINSLINALANSSIFRKIAFSSTFTPEVIYNNADIVNYLNELDDDTLLVVVRDLKIRLDFNISEYVKDNKVDRSLLKQLCKEISKEFEKKKDLYIERTEEREELINSLLDNMSLLSFTPLVTITSISEEHIREFKYDRRLVDFINQTSDLMILNNISYDFLDFLTPKFGDTLRNNFESLGDLTKDNNFKYSQNIVEKLGLMTFQPRTKEVVKREFFKKMFTAVNVPDFEALLNLELIKKAYDSKDEFGLMRAIKANDYIIANTDKYNTPIFSCIYNMIKDLMPEAEKFLAKYDKYNDDIDSKDISRLVYYLGDMFTVDEINKHYMKSYDSFDFTEILQRKDNETLIEYMDRLILAKQTGDSELIKYEPKFSKQLRKHSVVLENCSLPMLFVGTYGKHPTVTLTIIELFYQLLLRDLNTILRCIKLDKGIANKLADGEEPKLEYSDTEKEKARLYLTNSIYLDSRFNFTGNNGDLIELDKFTGEAELDLSVDSNKLLELIVEDEERFNNATKHLPKGVIDLIHEYYTFGEREN